MARPRPATSAGFGGAIMAFVVCEPCRGCKYTDCVTVCPCECFYQDEMMLYIDPDECIDCGACVPECPVEAIFDAWSIPPAWQHYAALNAERATTLKAEGRGITEKQAAKEGPGCRKHK